MSSRIIITDPHGCHKTLIALIDQLPADVPLTFAGDLIDRGPRSREIVEFVKNGGYDCVRGNHEDMMISDMKFDEQGMPDVDYYHSIWLYNGGTECLRSYEGRGDLLKEYLEWLKTLPFYLEYKDVKNEDRKHLVVSHSTIANVWTLRNSTDEREKRNFENTVMWERNPFPKNIAKVFNVYGHTPQDYEPTIRKHFACIDNGVYIKRNYNSINGRLFALQFPEMKLYEQENIED